MAQTGFTPIQIYSSATALNVPVASNLAQGELAINVVDGKLYYKDNSGVVQLLVQGSSGGGTFPTVTVTGSITASSNKGAIRQGTLGFSDTNIWQSYQTSVNSYAQVVMQNTSSGTAASTDFVVSNDLGNATTYYGNLGMNSSGFTGSGSLSLANAVYVSATSGDLVLGTTTSNAIRFVVNSGATDALTITSAGALTINGASTFNATGTFANSTGTKLTISGNVTSAPWTTTGRGLNIPQNIYLSSSTLSGTVVANNMFGPLLQATTASQTVTDAVTLYLTSPVASTNVTITNSWSLYSSGNAHFANDVYFNTNIISPFNVTGGTITAGATSLAVKLQITGNTTFVPWTTSGVGLRIGAGTYTSTVGLTGTVVANSIAQPTFATTSATQTITNAATLYIAAAPAAGTNVTITNSYALYIAAGDSYFGGTKLQIAGTAVTIPSGAFATTSGIGFSVASATYTSSSTLSGGSSVNFIGQPTYAATTAGQTLTNGYTFYIAGAPLGGTNVTITNPYALYIASGNSYFAGSISVNAGITANNTGGTKLLITGNDTAASWATSGIGLRIDAGTYTDATSAGVATHDAIHAIAQPTLAASVGTTFTNASTLYIANAPAAGSNVSITNPWALYIAAGDMYLGGVELQIAGTSSTIPQANFGFTGVGLSVAGATYTSAAGYSSNAAANSLGQPTFASTTAAQNIPQAYTLYIAGAPVAGTNTTISTSYAIYVLSGISLFIGQLQANGGASFGGSAVPKVSIAGSGNGANQGVSGAMLQIQSGTITDTSTTLGGTVAHTAVSGFSQTTLAANATSVIYTNASTIYIAAAPAAGTNVTITNPWALYVAAGNSYFAGTTSLIGNVVSAVTVTGGALTASATSAAAKFIISGNISASPWTTSGVGLQIQGATYTSTSTLSGLVAANSIASPQFAATTTAQTISTAATLYIASAPLAGTNVTITNSYALYIAAGDVYIGGASLAIGGVTATYPAARFGVIGVGISTSTVTYSSAAGYSGTVVVHNLAPSTFAAATASQTITIAATLYIAAAPNAGANTTITRGYSLYIAAGQAFFGGGIATTAPAVPASYINAATYVVTATDTSLIFTTTASTVTLPSAAAFPGRILYIKNVSAIAITSNASNVYPLATSTLGTAILAATAGKFAMLQSDGTNWVIMMAN